MPRAKSYNEALIPLAERISGYRAKAAKVRADYAARAEAEIAKQRAEIQREVAVDYANIGPSEMANSTGLSRSTVIRWRKDWAEENGDVDITKLIEDAEAGPEVGQFGFETWEGINTAYIETDGTRLFLLTGEDFGYGQTVVEAERNKVQRPDWLTDDLMREAVDATGVTLMLAPWKKK